jgi:hypothetical protein
MRTRNTNAIVAMALISFSWLLGEFLVQKALPSHRIVGELVTGIWLVAGLGLLLRNWLGKKWIEGLRWSAPGIMDV